MFAGITYSRIEEVGLQYPVPDETAPWYAFSICRDVPRGARTLFPAGVCAVPVAEEPDEEFPFVLTTGRLLEHWHGGTMTVPFHSWIRSTPSHMSSSTHEIDALRCHVDTGTWCAVRHGLSIVLRVAVS